MATERAKIDASNIRVLLHRDGAVSRETASDFMEMSRRRLISYLGLWRAIMTDHRRIQFSGTPVDGPVKLWLKEGKRDD